MNYCGLQLCCLRCRFFLELPLCALLPTAKGNSSPRAKVTRKRTKAKLVWTFAASVSNLSKGQRWEAQRAAEQCAEIGGMMFERSEFLPPQALRQAATGEVCTDWKMSQSDSWICFANRQYCQHIVVRSADAVCTARGAKRQYCQLEAPNAVHDCPYFWVLFSKKYWKKDLKKNTSERLRLRTVMEHNDERKRGVVP
jgi:hypothetical protein